MNNKILFSLLILFGVCFSCTDESKELPQETFNHGDFELIFENDPEGITFYFTGANYFGSDFEKTQGQYRRDGIRIINEIFDTPPFSEYREYFNAYIVYVNPELDSDPWENSPENIVRSLFPEFDETDVILLSNQYSNNNQGFAGGVVAFFPSDVKRTMIHEVGHIVGGLADEYYTLETDYQDALCAQSPNVDTTNNLDEIKWNHFIGLDGYENISAVPGGCYAEYGVWRSTNNCVMRHGNSYCAPCRESIVKKIMNVKGLSYDFEQFLLNDMIE